MTGTATLDAASSQGNQAPLVSIIINNYNYDCFLRDAIDSALNQPYDNTEVLVVDDGSTDRSREIIASYADRIIPVLKENGGQASAFNVGFERSHGEIVLFLDSDDLLLSHTVKDVVRVFRGDPRIVKVLFRLELIEADGTLTGIYMPSSELSMPSGDLRRHILLFPDDIRTPPTSGNAFAASALHEILPMPIPDPTYGKTGADIYLHNLVPLFGPVRSLSSVGGLYRTHEANHQYTLELDLGNIRRMIVRTIINHAYIRQHANRLQLPNVPTNSSDMLSVTFLINRIASLKLEPELHPIEDDSKPRLFRLGVKASFRRFDLPIRTRLLYIPWFLLAIYSPKAVTRWLVTKAFYPEHRGILGKLVR